MVSFSFVSVSIELLMWSVKAASISSNSHTQAIVKPCMTLIRWAAKCKLLGKLRHYVHMQSTVNDEAPYTGTYIGYKSSIGLHRDIFLELSCSPFSIIQMCVCNVYLKLSCIFLCFPVFISAV